MKKILLLSLTILMSAMLMAGHTFVVKTSKGDVKVQKAGKGNWAPLKTGAKLESTDQIKLASGAHLNLVHSNGNPIEVSKSGNYSIAKLESKANTKKSNVTKKFTNYLLDELGDSEDLLAEGNLSDNMSTLGAVERAIPKFSPNDMNIKMPRSSFALDDIVTFSWYPQANISEYTLVIRDSMENLIYEENVAGLEKELNLSSLDMEKGNCYFWSVKAGDKQSEELCVYRMTDDEKFTFDSELRSLRAELDENAALDNMILASFYSKKKVVPEAIAAFEKAIEIAPDIDNYKLIYGKYLMSVGLVKEAEKFKD